MSAQTLVGSCIFLAFFFFYLSFVITSFVSVLIWTIIPGLRLQGIAMAVVLHNRLVCMSLDTITNSMILRSMLSAARVYCYQAL